MTGLFDRYLIVDWSAANAPKSGADSIWIAELQRRGRAIGSVALQNPKTRFHAMNEIAQRLHMHIASGQRVFIGFDFPFGYPQGAAALIAGKASWNALWQSLAREVDDDERNRSNRYHLANDWNQTRFSSPLFWGHPHQHRYSHISARKPLSEVFKAIEFRTVEHWQPPAKSVWQLAYNGAVGSQAILGMAHLQHLRDRLGNNAAIWPYETGWTSRLAAPVTIAEVYPSMFTPVFREGDVKDAAQVRTVAKAFARLDRDGTFARWLSRPAGLSDRENKAVLTQEGWIVGAGHQGTEQS